MVLRDVHKGRVLVIVLVIILFVAINILSTNLLTNAQIDLTEDRLYTLSEGTTSILEGLEEPIRLRFFFSESVATAYPTVMNYARRVRSLLKRYESLAGGKLTLEIIDPEPFSPAEDEAVAAGLKGATTATGETLYFGLAGSNSTDTERVIPYFTTERERFLEYDLTKMVYELAHPEKPVLGLISSLPLEFGPGGPMAAAQGQSQPYFIYEQLKDAFSLRPLGNIFDHIDDDVDVLLIAHPGELGEAELYAIDQYILGGGRALVFLDPYLESSSYMQAGVGGNLPSASTLGPLLAAWGVEMTGDKVIADRALAHRVSVPDETGSRKVTDYLVWLALGPAQLDDRDVVTADLETLNLATAGSLSAIDGATTRIEPLATSSDQSMLMDVGTVRFEQDPDQLLRGFEADGVVKVIGARITGPVASAFDGPPATDEGQDGDRPAHRNQSAGDINVILVADADMLEDRFWVQLQSFLGQRVAVPLADNGAFVINAVENLSGSSDLISLRSRGVSQRPFTLVEEIRREAEDRFAAEERRLQAKLDETEARLRELEEGSGDAAIMDQTQAEEIEAFRQEMLATRKELRDVQHQLRKDIEALGGWVKFINIALMPIIVSAVAFGLAAARRRRRIRLTG
ncbi:MAG: ABC transporter [Alphaproteobacteria bacterium]|nr:MAG: ABC transporter [Alphaproteobacteria bacterium]